MPELTLTKYDKMALGRRAAYLRGCILAGELMAKYETDCSVRKRTFEKFIQPELRVSYPTFSRMISVINPQKELEEINKTLELCRNTSIIE